MNRDLASRFAEMASSHGSNPAIVLPAGDGMQFLSYEQLNSRRIEIADALERHHQIAAGDRVGIVQSRQIDTIAAMLGVVSLGASYVPLDLELPPERLKFIMEDAGIRLVLNAEAGDLQNSVAISTLQGTHRSFPEVSEQSCVYVMFTSGSTGKPKGVVIPHRAVYRLVVDTNFMPLNERTRFLQLAPQSFDAATLEIWGPLMNGGTVVLYPDEVVDPVSLQNVIRGQQVNSLWLTAALFNQFVSRWPDALDGLDTILFGGERASVPHVQAAFERYPETTLINGYGPTENTTFTCCHKVSESDFSSSAGDLPVGRPINGTIVKIVDTNGNEVEQGQSGELIAGGLGVASGYLNRDDLTAAAFFVDESGARWYRTGDLASQSDNGEVRFFGRIDRQIKIAGHRIEPGELEIAIMRSDAIQNVYVCAQETRDEDRKLVAYVVGNFDEQALRSGLADQLPAYMIPSAFVALETLPITANGKVDTAKLPNPFMQERTSHPSEQGDQVAVAIAKIWRDVVSGLNLSNFDENFFDVGGTSMDMLRVKQKLDEILQREIPAVSLFTYPTINKLAKHLSRNEEIQPVAAGIRDRAAQRRQQLSLRRKRQD